MGHSITGLPGFRTVREAAYRNIRRDSQDAKYLSGGAIIDADLSGDAGNTGHPDVLRPGKLMVKAASGGLYRNFIIGKTTAAYTDNDVVLTVSAATATEIGRLLTVTGAALDVAFIGPEQAAGTNAVTNTQITAVASATTVTVPDLGLNKVTDSLIALRTTAYTAGSFCFVDDGTGIKLSDEDGVRIDQPFTLPLIGGMIDESQIIDWPANALTVAYLKSIINTATTGSNFTFDAAL